MAVGGHERAKSLSYASMKLTGPDGEVKEERLSTDIDEERLKAFFELLSSLFAKSDSHEK